MTEKHRQGGLSTVIIVLVVLLALSLTALAGMAIYKNILGEQSKTAIIPGNVITPQLLEPSNKTVSLAAQDGEVVLLSARSSGGATKLKLYLGQSQDGTAFTVENMFPGDSVTKTFALEVSYKGSLPVYFNASVREGATALANCLTCKIVVRNDPDVCYEGLLKDASLTYTLPESAGTTATVTYEITVSLPTSAGNDCANQQLIADFTWSAEKAEEPTIPPTPPIPPTEPTNPPTEPTNPPTEPTNPPTEPTNPPTEPTNPPTEPTNPPTEPTNPPTEPTNPPTEPTDPPTEPTDPPTEPTNPPTEPTQPAPTTTVPSGTGQVPTTSTASGQLIPKRCCCPWWWIILLILIIFFIILIIIWKKRKEEDEENV